MAKDTSVIKRMSCFLFILFMTVSPYAAEYEIEILKHGAFLKTALGVIEIFEWLFRNISHAHRTSSRILRACFMFIFLQGGIRQPDWCI